MQNLRCRPATGNGHKHGSQSSHITLKIRLFGHHKWRWDNTASTEWPLLFFKQAKRCAAHFNWVVNRGLSVLFLEVLCFKIPKTQSCVAAPLMRHWGNGSVRLFSACCWLLTKPKLDGPYEKHNNSILKYLNCSPCGALSEIGGAQWNKVLASFRELQANKMHWINLTSPTLVV